MDRMGIGKLSEITTETPNAGIDAQQKLEKFQKEIGAFSRELNGFSSFLSYFALAVF